MELRHEPVMLQEVLAALPLRPGAVVVDGTLGLAGHSAEFCTRISPGGTLVAFDRDPAMLAEAMRRLDGVDGVVMHAYNENFTQVPTRLDELDVKADAMLFDLGLNNAQIESSDRGFSFANEGPLDMRMDPTSGESAAEWLNHADRNEIDRTLHEFGDERWSKRIADAIVSRRPLRTTSDLVECVEAAIPTAARREKIHPATRTFQAVRIRVNHELADLDGHFERCSERLAAKGVIAVLAYHSGEDRIVKRAFRNLAKDERYELPNKRPIRPTEGEIDRNRKSRSARLRTLRRAI